MLTKLAKLFPLLLLVCLLPSGFGRRP